MCNVWRFTSWDLTMFTVARDYKEACKWFKMMVMDVIQNPSEGFFLDEIIGIERLDREGKTVENESGIEFTEEWLKEIGLEFDTIAIRC
jgi:hypothetical protein